MSVKLKREFSKTNREWGSGLHSRYAVWKDGKDTGAIVDATYHKGKNTLDVEWVGGRRGPEYVQVPVDPVKEPNVVERWRLKQIDLGRRGAMEAVRQLANEFPQARWITGVRTTGPSARTDAAGVVIDARRLRRAQGSERPQRKSSSGGEVEVSAHERGGYHVSAYTRSKG